MFINYIKKNPRKTLALYFSYLFFGGMVHFVVYNLKDNNNFKNVNFVNKRMITERTNITCEFNSDCNHGICEPSRNGGICVCSKGWITSAAEGDGSACNYEQKST